MSKKMIFPPFEWCIGKYSGLCTLFIKTRKLDPIFSTCSPYVTFCYSPVIAVDQLPVLPHSCSPLDGRCAQVRPDLYISLLNLVISFIVIVNKNFVLEFIWNSVTHCNAAIRCWHQFLLNSPNCFGWKSSSYECDQVKGSNHYFN